VDYSGELIYVYSAWISKQKRIRNDDGYVRTPIAVIVKRTRQWPNYKQGESCQADQQNRHGPRRDRYVPIPKRIVTHTTINRADRRP